MKTLRKPDLHAPRFRETRMSVLTQATLKEFKKKYPEYQNISLVEFKNIVMTFNNNVVQGVIENRNGVELPDGLGFIFMGTCPTPKTKIIDYKKSIDSGIETAQKNWDSDNKLLKIFYTNRTSKYPFAHKEIWAFKAVKQFRQKASEAYRENFAKYIEVSPNIKISTMFDRYRKKEYIQNLKPIIPEDYDEFKM